MKKATLTSIIKIILVIMTVLSIALLSACALGGGGGSGGGTGDGGSENGGSGSGNEGGGSENGGGGTGNEGGGTENEGGGSGTEGGFGKYTEGLKFTLDDATDTYFVSKYEGTEAEVVIPSVYETKAVTGIGREAFIRCNGVTRIYIPSNVTNIDYSAFYEASGLTAIVVSEDNPVYKSVDGNLYSKNGKTLFQYSIGKSEKSFTIPSGVEFIDTFAFRKAKLEGITVSEGVINMGSYAFSASALKNVTLPQSLTVIGFGAFSECKSLESITIPSNVTYVQSYAFSSCTNLASVTFNGTSKVEGIGACAFYECEKLTDITIPDSVLEIGGSAFYKCTQLNTVTIGKNSKLETIGTSTFYRCRSLKEIYIPFGVTSLGADSFKGCDHQDLVICCEVASQPQGWASNWNPDNCTVQWGDKLNPDAPEVTEPEFVGAFEAEAVGPVMDPTVKFAPDAILFVAYTAPVSNPVISIAGVQNVKYLLEEFTGQYYIYAYEVDTTNLPTGIPIMAVVKYSVDGEEKTDRFGLTVVTGKEEEPGQGENVDKPINPDAPGGSDEIPDGFVGGAAFLSQAPGGAHAIVDISKCASLYIFFGEPVENPMLYVGKDEAQLSPIEAFQSDIYYVVVFEIDTTNWAYGEIVGAYIRCDGVEQSVDYNFAISAEDIPDSDPNEPDEGGEGEKPNPDAYIEFVGLYDAESNSRIADWIYTYPNKSMVIYMLFRGGAPESAYFEYNDIPASSVIVEGSYIGTVDVDGETYYAMSFYIEPIYAEGEYAPRFGFINGDNEHSQSYRFTVDDGMDAPGGEMAEFVGACEPEAIGPTYDATVKSDSCATLLVCYTAPVSNLRLMINEYPYNSYVPYKEESWCGYYTYWFEIDTFILPSDNSYFVELQHGTSGFDLVTESFQLYVVSNGTGYPGEEESDPVHLGVSISGENMQSGTYLSVPHGKDLWIDIYFDKYLMGSRAFVADNDEDVSYETRYEGEYYIISVCAPWRDKDYRIGFEYYLADYSLTTLYIDVAVVYGDGTEVVYPNLVGVAADGNPMTPGDCVYVPMGRLVPIEMYFDRVFEVARVFESSDDYSIVYETREENGYFIVKFDYFAFEHATKVGVQYRLSNGMEEYAYIGIEPTEDPLNPTKPEFLGVRTEDSEELTYGDINVSLTGTAYTIYLVIGSEITPQDVSADSLNASIMGAYWDTDGNFVVEVALQPTMTGRVQMYFNYMYSQYMMGDQLYFEVGVSEGEAPKFLGVTYEDADSYTDVINGVIKGEIPRITFVFEGEVEVFYLYDVAQNVIGGMPEISYDGIYTYATFMIDTARVSLSEGYNTLYVTYNRKNIYVEYTAEVEFELRVARLVRIINADTGEDVTEEKPEGYHVYLKDRKLNLIVVYSVLPSEVRFYNCLGARPDEYVLGEIKEYDAGLGGYPVYFSLSGLESDKCSITMKDTYENTFPGEDDCHNAFIVQVDESAKRDPAIIGFSFDGVNIDADTLTLQRDYRKPVYVILEGVTQTEYLGANIYIGEKRDVSWGGRTEYSEELSAYVMTCWPCWPVDCTEPRPYVYEVRIYLDEPDCQNVEYLSFEVTVMPVEYGV